MRVTIFLIAVLLLTILTSKAQSIDKNLAQFWKNSDLKVVNGLISDVAKSVYFTEIRKKYPNKTFSEVIAKMETIRNDYPLQDYLYLRFLEMYGTGELLRIQMADICGTFALGNYVSKYIVDKYSKCERYITFIKEKQTREEVKKAQQNETESPETTTDSVYVHVETEAQFPGGNAAYVNYLQKEIGKIKDPPSIEILVSFIVTQDGILDSIKIENPTNTQIDQQILAVFKNCPKWIPAEVNGIQIRTRRRQTIVLGDSE